MFSSVSGVFRLLFQVFHLDVVKVDLDVAYVAMTKYTYCKSMFQVFRRMLQMFHLNVSKVDLGVAHIANGYTRMFQMFHCLHTYVADILCECFKSRSGVAYAAMASVTGGWQSAEGFASYLILSSDGATRPLLSSPSPPFPSSPVAVRVRPTSARSCGRQ
jgi:hypothetical protein